MKNANSNQGISDIRKSGKLVFATVTGADRNLAEKLGVPLGSSRFSFDANSWASLQRDARGPVRA